VAGRAAVEFGKAISTRRVEHCWKAWRQQRTS
jgi:hypothetical protein